MVPTVETADWKWSVPVTRIGNFEPKSDDLQNQPPEKFVFRLEKAVKVSGKIISTDNEKPLPIRTVSGSLHSLNVGFTSAAGMNIDCGFNIDIDESGRYFLYLLPGEYRLAWHFTRIAKSKNRASFRP